MPDQRIKNQKTKNGVFTLSNIIEKIKGCSGCAKRREWLKKQRLKAEERLKAIREKKDAEKNPK